MFGYVMCNRGELRKEERNIFKCALHPWKNKTELTNKYTDYAADMTIALTYHKCLDDRMSEEEIAKAMYDAQVYVGQDRIRRDALALSDEAKSLLARTQQAMKNAGKSLEKTEKKQVKSDCAALEKCLKKMAVHRMSYICSGQPFWHYFFERENTNSVPTPSVLMTLIFSSCA